MRAFAIADASKRRSRPVGLLFWEPDSAAPQGRFSLELASTCDEAALPLSLSFCAGRAGRRATPQESEDWVRSRIVPENRHNITEVLRANGLREYDEIALFAACQGRSSDDDYLAYELALPVWLLDELEGESEDGLQVESEGKLAGESEGAGQAAHVPGQSRADRILSAVERRRVGGEVRYAIVGLPVEGASDREAQERAGGAARSVGRQIRTLRHEAGLTQKQLAARTGITQTVLSRVESGGGNPTLSLIEEIASALGADLNISLD